MSVINTLSHYESPKITDRKSFITLGPGGVIIFRLIQSNPVSVEISKMGITKYGKQRILKILKGFCLDKLQL
jgi:hypothetical protein